MKKPLARTRGQQHRPRPEPHLEGKNTMAENGKQAVDALDFIQQLRDDKHIKITRQGNVFQYRNGSESSPTTVTMEQVFAAAKIAICTQEDVHAALSYLRDSLLNQAQTGKDLNEYAIEGVASLYNSLAGMVLNNLDERYAENQIIKAMAMGGAV